MVNDPRIRTKYNKEVKAKLRSKGMLEKAALLRKMVADNLASPDSPPHSMQEVNALHLELNNARRDLGWEVALKIRKRHTGARPFSLRMQQLLDTIMLWSKVIYYRTHKRTGSRQIRRMMKKRNIHDAFQISVAEAKWRRKVL